jgi:hypothetical protein
VSERRRPVLLGVLFCLALVIGTIVSYTWIASQQHRAKTLQAAGKFAQLELALRHYYTEHNEFPLPDFYSQREVPRHSWRISLLPYLEFQDFSSRYAYDEAWNSRKNLDLALEFGHAPSYFRSPFSRLQHSLNADYFLADPTEVKKLASRGYRTHRVFEGKNEVVIVEIPNSQIHWLNSAVPDN